MGGMSFIAGAIATPGLRLLKKGSDPLLARGSDPFFSSLGFEVLEQ
jgi:hypothetical protein